MQSITHRTPTTTRPTRPMKTSVRLRISHRCPLVLQSTPRAPRPAVHSAAQVQDVALSMPKSLSQVLKRFESAGDAKERYRLLLDAAKQLPSFSDACKTMQNRVMGCTTQVWMTAELDAQGLVQLRGTSDSELSRGLCAILVQGLSGLSPQEVLQVAPEDLQSLGPGLALTPSRVNGLANMVETVRKRVRMLTHDLPKFPSLVIGADVLLPQGAFAEAQAQYLQPDQQQVSRLVELLSSKRIGVVAHFYMDPQVQGVLSQAAERWPHVHISDSLVMADSAVKMAEAGCQAVCVLGVDFMSENVRAILDEAGHTGVAVYRMSSESIGCSLAEAAESEQYMSYLGEAAATPQSLHVIYINTSLRTKALAHAALPTITCTSSNVVQTVLQAFAQVPDASVWYGPDTYMGANLAKLFSTLASASDEEIAALHPGHDRRSIRRLLPRLHSFQDGTCIVHHLFGGEVCELAREGYGDAYIAAHFEVPGEMFALAMDARKRGMGVVGSTSNILDFIADKVKAALQLDVPERLQVVLGTESGMVTSIVRKVQAMLRAAGRTDVEVEIVFPVAPQAITTGRQQTASGSAPELPGGLRVLPGSPLGEGCSLEGGCSTCPYMKMNTLAALQMVCERVGTPAEALLEAYRPRQYSETVNGLSMAKAGTASILHMRHFQQKKTLSEELVADIITRNALPR